MISFGRTGRLRLPTPDHLAALTDVHTWRDNPFVHRDLYRDLNRKTPLKWLASLCVILLITGAFALKLLLGIFKSRHGFSWIVGGDLPTALCFVLCGVHIWFIAGTAQRYAARLLAQEAHQDTLSSLLMLPTSRFQMLLQIAVYPWLAAMRMAVALLPVYVFFVGLDVLTWTDLVMLYVVYALASVSFPLWGRPALGDMSGSVAVMPGTTKAITGTSSPNQMLALTGARPQSGFGGMFFVVYMLNVFLWITTLSHGPANAHRILAPYLPDSLIALLPNSLFSWPLLIARTLITPLDWFGIPIPPLLFVAASFITGLYAQIVRTAEYLSVGTYQDLAQLPTYVPRRQLEATLRIGQWLALTGYLWKWLVRNGGLAWIVNLRGGVHAPGLPGFAYLLLFLMAARGLYRAMQLANWHLAPRTGRNGVVKRHIPLRSTLIFLASPYLGTLLFYLACCVLSRANPFPASVIMLAGEMTAIGLAGMLAAYGAYRIFGGLASLLSLALCMAWFYGTLVVSTPGAASLAYFSPLLGLLNLGNLHLPNTPPLFPQALPWWMWLERCGLLGGALTAFGLLLNSRRDVRTGDKEPAPALDPTIVGPTEPFTDQAYRREDDPAMGASPLAAWLLAFTGRYTDNAVVMKEMRSRLRGKLQPRLVRFLIGVALIVTVSCIMLIPAVPEAFGGGFAGMLYGPIASPVIAATANTLACWYILLLISAPLVAISIFPQVFAIEREKSTLGFLLMTPMRATAIIWGKIAGLLLAGGSIPLGLGFGTLLMSALLAPAIGVLPSFQGWLEVTLSALAIMLTLSMIVLAFASLFPRALAPWAASLIWIVSIQVFINGFRQIAWFFDLLGLQDFDFFGLQGIGRWFLFLGVCILITLLANIVAVWGVRRLRRHDIAFASAKKEN